MKEAAVAALFIVSRAASGAFLNAQLFGTTRPPGSKMSSSSNKGTPSQNVQGGLE